MNEQECRFRLKSEALIILTCCFCGLFLHTKAQNSLAGTISGDVVKIECTKMFPFSEGIAVVRNEGSSWCTIDAMGKTMIPYNKFIANGKDYEDIGFRSGLLRINLKNGLVGFINSKGDYVIKPQYVRAGNFNNFDFTLAIKPSIGPVDKKIRRDVILHRNGLEVPYPHTKFNSDQISHDGLILIHSLSTPNLYGYMDKNAKVVVPEKYIGGNPFSEGLASVAIKDAEGNTKWGYIDTKGVVVIPFQFSNQPLPFSNGLALIKPLKMDFDYAFIDNKGEVKIKLKESEVGSISWFGQSKQDVKEIINGSFKGSVAQWNSRPEPATISPNLILLDKNGQLINMDKILLSKGFVLKKLDSEIKDDKLILITDKGSGLFDVKGNIFIEPLFSKLSLFDEKSHLAYAEKIMSDKQILKGYINESGVFVIIMVAKSGW